MEKALLPVGRNAILPKPAAQSFVPTVRASFFVIICILLACFPAGAQSRRGKTAAGNPPTNSTARSTVYTGAWKDNVPPSIRQDYNNRVTEAGVEYDHDVARNMPPADAKKRQAERIAAINAQFAPYWKEPKPAAAKSPAVKSPDAEPQEVVTVTQMPDGTRKTNVFKVK